MHFWNYTVTKINFLNAFILHLMFMGISASNVGSTHFMRTLFLHAFFSLEIYIKDKYIFLILRSQNGIE